MDYSFPSTRTRAGFSQARFWCLLTLATLSTLIFWTGFSQPTHAHEGEDNDQTTAQAEAPETNTANDQFVPEQYQYSVVKGHNMTLLVRRSIQMFDQAKSGVDLDQARIIYAENHVVNELGARDLIQPGEALSVDSGLIEKFVTDSQDLSPSSLAAWQSYADNANFELDDIKADNVDVSDDGQLEPANDNDQNDEAEQPTVEASDNEDGADDDNPVWPWLFLGAGTLALLWYALWRQPEDK